MFLPIPWILLCTPHKSTGAGWISRISSRRIRRTQIHQASVWRQDNQNRSPQLRIGLAVLGNFWGSPLEYTAAHDQVTSSAYPGPRPAGYALLICEGGEFRFTHLAVLMSDLFSFSPDLDMATSIIHIAQCEIIREKIRLALVVPK